MADGKRTDARSSDGKKLFAGLRLGVGPKAASEPAETPHAAMALFAAPAGAPAGPAARSGRYEEIKAQLFADAAGLDAEEVGKARKIASAIGQSLLDRLLATRVADNLFWVGRIFVVFFFFAFVWFTFQAGMRRPAADAGFAAIVFVVGFLVAAFVESTFRVFARGARRKFDQASDALEEIVRVATGRFRDALVPRRARMQAGSGARDALTASAEARLLTAGALRFFSQAPFIGVQEAGAGHTCGNVASALRAAGQRARAASDQVTINTIIAAAGAAVGAAFILASLSSFEWRGPPPALKTLMEFGFAHPVAALSVAFMALLLLFAMIPGYVAAQLEAAAHPERVLAAEPTKTIANNLHLRVLQAAAEQQREFIERYADALIALETRSSSWGDGGTAGHHAASADSDIPQWRRAPEGPRFVETGFQASPKAFLMGPEGASAGGSPTRGSAPKRRLFGLGKPSGA